MNSEKVISNIKKAIKEHLDNNYAYDMLVDFELDVIDWNSLFEYIDKLQQENEQLKDNWNELKKWLRIKDILANSKINPQSIKFKDLLKHMEYLEKER